MAIKLSNNAVSKLAGNITASDTTISMVPGDGALFPSLSAGDWFPATIMDSAGNLEIVKCTARSVDTLTVVRAQEDTSARAFNAGDRIELRLTALVLETLQSDLASQALPSGFGPIPWSLPTLPSGWDWADGAVLLAATPYQSLRNAYIAAGFPHGQDGSGNQKKPDMRGRTAAGLDNMGTTGAAGRLTGATIGAGLGSQTHTLSTAEMPVHAHGVSDPTHAHSVSDSGHAHTASTATGGSHSHTTNAWSNSGGGINVSATGAGLTAQSAITSSSHAGHSHGVTVNGALTGIGIFGASTGISVQNAGSGGAHNNVQPTLAVPWIVKT